MKPTLQLFLLFSLAFMLLSQAKADEDEPAEGAVAPDFSIVQMDGKRFQLSEYRGKKPVYLVFWNTWCTYCMKKIPKLKEAQQNLQNDIAIIAVNTSLKDSVEKSERFKSQFNINYPLAFDHGERVTDLYGVWGTPTEFIIDIDGVIRHRDGVPDDLRAHLAGWSQPANSQIADTLKSCDEESQRC